MPFSVFSQKYTIFGYTGDSQTGEKLISASVYDTVSKKGAITNSYGFYSLTLDAGKVVLVYSYVGYQPVVKEIGLSQNVPLSVNLNPSISLGEIEVVAYKEDSHVEKNQMSVNELPVSVIKSLPVLFGEVDLIKTIQLLPGVQSGGEGTSGLYVRGGGPDQNLILLDGVPVYNCDHLFGFFSVFNADAIHNVTLIKGGFPARFGGRLSSVLDIRMKEGNLKEVKGEGSVGLISSKFTIEGPLKKEKSSFIFSGRRTYIDILTQPIIMSMSDGVSAGYYFYDMNAKVNYIFSDTDRVFLSIYTGRDRAYSRMKEDYNNGGVHYENKNKASLSWGNITSALRWNHMFNRKLFSNLTTTYSRYRFRVQGEFSEKETEAGNVTEREFQYGYFSGINDFSGKLDFNWHPRPAHSVIFGMSDIYHTFSPGINIFKYSESSSESNIDTTFGNNNIYANEFSVYCEDDIKVNDLLKINIGLHYCGFFVRNHFYQSLQPRISARRLLNEKMSVKLAFTQMNQNIHLLTNSGIGLPTDLWLPVTDKIIPQVSYQAALGFFYDILKNYEFSIEGYYKPMKNLIEYKEGVDFFSTYESWENKVEQGSGLSYGTEILLRKTKGSTNGWIGYTLAWTNRTFPTLNNGKTFPYRYDRRHDIAVVIMHKFSDNTDAGITWVYGTGNAVSLPIEKYPGVYSQSIQFYEGRNSFRMPAYHRLDIGVNFHKVRKNGVRTWSLGVYNIYNRKNPFYLTFGNDKYGRPRLIQVSLFPMIPSFSYSFKF